MTPGSLNLTVFYSKENLTIFSFILGVLKFYNKELLHLQIYLVGLSLAVVELTIDQAGLRFTEIRLSLPPECLD